MNLNLSSVIFTQFHGYNFVPSLFIFYSGSIFISNIKFYFDPNVTTKDYLFIFTQGTIVWVDSEIRFFFISFFKPNNFSGGYINTILKIQAVNTTLSNVIFENYTFNCGSLAPFYAENKNTSISANFHCFNFILKNITPFMSPATFLVFLARSFNLVQIFFFTANNISNTITGCGLIYISNNENVFFQHITLESIFSCKEYF